MMEQACINFGVMRDDPLEPFNPLADIGPISDPPTDEELASLARQALIGADLEVRT